MSTPQPSFKGLPIQINVFAEFVKKWALDHNTTYAKALKSKKMKKDFLAYRATLPLSKPIQKIQQFPPSSFVKADISPNQPAIPSDVADIAPEMGTIYPEEESTESGQIKIRVKNKTKKRKTQPVVEMILYDIEEDIPPLSPLPEEEPPKIVWQQYKSLTTGTPLWYNPETTETTYERPTTGTIEVIEGGKLSAPEIKSFVSASYVDRPDPTIDDWLLDTKLSNETAKVYYNPKEKRAVVVHRGTQGLSDWGNNLAYVLGGYEMTDRYKMGKDTQNRAEKKYGAKNISTLGHSQGAILARKLGANTKEVITVNPAYKFEKPLPNEFVIRSSSDVVSGAYAPVAAARSVLMPKKSQNRDITIPSENRFDVLGEHSSDILDRLPKDQMIGTGSSLSSEMDRHSAELNAAELRDSYQRLTQSLQIIGDNFNNAIRRYEFPEGVIEDAYNKFRAIEDLLRSIRGDIRSGSSTFYWLDEERIAETLGMVEQALTTILQYIQTYTDEDQQTWLAENVPRPTEVSASVIQPPVSTDVSVTRGIPRRRRRVEPQSDLNTIVATPVQSQANPQTENSLEQMPPNMNGGKLRICGCGAGPSVIVPVDQFTGINQEEEQQEEEQPKEEERPITKEEMAQYNRQYINEVLDDYVKPLEMAIREYGNAPQWKLRADRHKFFNDNIRGRIYEALMDLESYIQSLMYHTHPFQPIRNDYNRLIRYFALVEAYLKNEYDGNLVDKFPELETTELAQRFGGMRGYGIKKARPSKIQTILFSKDKWTKRKATAWLKKHNYSNKGVDDKPDTLRYRQLDPAYVEKIGYTQYITKPLGDSGVSLVIVYK